MYDGDYNRLKCVYYKLFHEESWDKIASITGYEIESMKHTFLRIKYKARHFRWFYYCSFGNRYWSELDYPYGAIDPNTEKFLRINRENS